METITGGLENLRSDNLGVCFIAQRCCPIALSAATTSCRSLRGVLSAPRFQGQGGKDVTFASSGLRSQCVELAGGVAGSWPALLHRGLPDRVSPLEVF